MSRMRCVLGLLCAIAWGSDWVCGADGKNSHPEPVGKRVTHKQTLTIPVDAANGNSLQTMTLLSDGRVAALVGPARYHHVGGPQIGERIPVHEVRLFDSQGKLQATLPLKFAGQAVTGGPDGILYVAGDGRLAKYSAEGKLLREIALPYIESLLADKSALEKLARETLEAENRQREAVATSISDQIKVLEKRVADLKTKAEKDRTASESRRLQRYEDQLENYRAQMEAYRTARGGHATVEQVLKSLITRSRQVNSLAATADHVFVVCGETKGYGYSVWKMDTEFKTSKKVLSELRGCCGQMDVKAHHGHLYVAENTRHHVGVYDYDGKAVRTIGHQGGADGFGSCCNPMNLCIGPEGALFTAESEGIIRQFNPAGEQVALVGKASLTGGCKNVAVGVSPKGDQVYFCDLPGSRIVVLSLVTDAAEAEALARQVQRDAQPQVQPAGSTSGLGAVLRLLFGK